ncbi:FtsK/SpoIIIE family DNA translocase [Capnocytophaga catalasegens]|uniref:DNA translocase FtsK n=1 Tax=Capnocytophaga catalasegens TaxID=1004260 RepID=A0AAV5AUB6_9FLAO|nr:DNA translocase FtsK [Capnocytophaga catalasegens]GIZ14040.1 DNA translocase FtsK [Capnocytophaga catalasegens]GJM49037.1 DNA translocase FtsK [Capnocytophaga catalasegens]GJM52298.1 DNA translocase FtsK [Capnocytophaga catalasegens]
MSKKKKATPSNADKKQQRKIMLGFFLLMFSILLSFAFVSYMFSWQVDQSLLTNLSDRNVQAKNILSKIGAFLGNLFIYKGFGIATFIPVVLLALSGLKILLELKIRLLNRWFWGILWMLFISICLGFFNSEATILSGISGYEINRFMQDYIGSVGTGLILLTIGSIYCIGKFNITPEKLRNVLTSSRETIGASKNLFQKVTHRDKDISSQEISNQTSGEDTKNTASEVVFKEISLTEKPQSKVDVYTHKKDIPPLEIEVRDVDTEVITSQSFEVKVKKEEEIDPKLLAQQLVENFGEYDPTLELKNYQFPPVDLLKEYSNTGVIRDDAELNENKNTIIQTLRNYKIEIVKISAIIGPTVTLYEIVPAPGIKIARIKSLEDDIALSLAALGIRIIAPIPGKGTVGIEVPNKKPSMVSMRSVISSQRFQTAEMELPVAFGKTITNETYVVDLTKMPHLLMAGATGQGKSVGLNAVLTSLLYKKHPAEVKFVLVDPKKVELTLYNKIERHYLAKLPDSEEAIITDNTKVINTLNSLCIEMDNRYELLKNAMVRNIKEYNVKFKARQLNPNEGHQFLPYIVLVVDEFADLIMTAGKEVELPIARLAQLARAIGIHLIIATQRPSVNVITGIIKANFPARVAFRVTSKIDSKTILDGSGADQLIGKGDMLYTQGNDMVRIQCAFVDTPEVEKIVDFIGAQKAYPDAHLLPEYVGEGSSEPLEFDASDRDVLFREAAEIIVNAQQGSASLLQRKLKLGYNRAGRLIDQLEAAGIVGPFEGSKARRVLITDVIALEQFFENNL